MVFVSSILGKPVADLDGESVGRVIDLVASPHGEVPHPVIVAVMVKCGGQALIVPLTEVVVLVAPAISLKHRTTDISPYQPGERDLYLARDVLDKQIIDTNGMRVVRVNDVDLARVNGDFYVANVDIGSLGLLRRLGLAKITERVVARMGRKVQAGVVSWDDVELLPGDQAMRLKVPGERIADLHPADLAEILSDLSRPESHKLLESLDVKTVADTLEEVEPDFQASLIQGMADDRAADVLEEMAPDEAADLLAELPEERSEDILNLMEAEEAQDVRMLLTYPEDSAGGIMTTEYITVRPDLSAQQAIAVLRETASEAETIYYVYVTEGDDHLVGVFSLKDLVLAQPKTPVAQFMHQRVISVSPLDSQDDVAQAVSKYNLLAVPVVDEQGRLQGIVTADDALDKIIPTAWKKRLPRLFN
jgi:magnesium transporter